MGETPGTEAALGPFPATGRAPAPSAPEIPVLGAHLVHTVQELQEDGSKPAALPRQGLSPTVAEAVPEAQPLLLHKQAEAFQRPVVGVGQELHQGHNLQGQEGLEMLHGGVMATGRYCLRHLEGSYLRGDVPAVLQADQH